MDNLYERVVSHFDGNEIKAKLWFRTANPMLGGLSPEEMIVAGRIERLRNFILEAEELNKYSQPRIQDQQTYSKDYKHE